MLGHLWSGSTLSPLFCCCSLCSTCPSSGGWFSTTVCLSEFWRSVRAILWVHKSDEVITRALVFPDVQTDGYAFIGQEEHRLHARAALPVRPHGRFYPQVCGSLSCCGVTEGCLQDQRGPTGTNLLFYLISVCFPKCFFVFLSALGREWVFPQTSWLAGGCISAGCQWKVVVCHLPRYSVSDTWQWWFLLYLQWCCRQTAESHGPTVLRYLCNREKNRWWVLHSFFMLRISFSSFVHLCCSLQVKHCVTSSSLVSTPCRWTGSTTFTNAWKVPWLRRRSSPCIQITASRQAARWT